MLKVGFDISQLAFKGGVATYSQNLAGHLSGLSDLEMIYFYSSLRTPYKGNLKKVKSFRFPPSLLEVMTYRLRNFKIERFVGDIDIYHSSDWLQMSSNAKKVTTYHDVVPIKFPQWSHPKIIDIHRKRLRIVEKEIDLVIAVSNSTKKDLMEVSNIPEEKIRVIYEGPSGDFKPESSEKIKEFKQKYDLPEKFVLAIGGIGERRNLSAIKQASSGYNLVITGENIPWIESTELNLLYSSASVLLYPSFYEGFGIPILDAFLCGTPVITSNISSMPEVGGEAAVYVNPKNPAEIAKKLKEVMEDKALRESLIQKGFKQAKNFSWEKAAVQTKKLYQSLIKK